jgi:Domain of unknown function (DUF4349)
MRVIQFPQPAGAPGEPTLAEIEAALHGDAVGESAEQWRDLRADLRALAPPLPPGLEQRLRERIDERAAAPRGARATLAKLNAYLGLSQRHRAAALAGALLVLVLLAVVVVAPWHSSSSRELLMKGNIADGSSPAPARATELGPSNAEGSVASSAGPTADASPSVPARVQQRAASLTLAARPAEVQSLSDRVAQLAVREGGIVQSSQVHLESGAAGEADLHLSLPSAHLSTALASLARLAPTRAESQQLQDITDEYDAAKRKLSDAVAERQALLHALARASTQGAIESLHARLSLARAAITHDREAFESISKRGSNANVEVSVIGNVHASSGGLSVSRGLHDAGDVLRVSLAVLLIALAVLVPLAVLAALAGFGWRASRRRLRERALS